MFARRHAMTFRLDSCIIVKKKSTVICCINCGERFFLKFRVRCAVTFKLDVFARRRAMTFRLDLCIIVQKKIRLYICCINCVALSFHTHFYSCIFHPLLYRADISIPAFSTPAFSVPPFQSAQKRNTFCASAVSCITVLSYKSETTKSDVNTTYNVLHSLQFGNR